MENFVKITDEIVENNNVEDYLIDELKEHIGILFNKLNNNFIEAIYNCESPIEQLLAIEMERVGLRYINLYNPFIEIIDIEKQAEIKCGRKKYRVDFQIPVIYKNQKNLMFVIECDGYEFHQKTKKQVEYDNKRQRDLQKLGYEIIRFSGTEIWNDPYGCACEIKNIILSKCQYIKGD